MGNMDCTVLSRLRALSRMPNVGILAVVPGATLWNPGFAPRGLVQQARDLAALVLSWCSELLPMRQA